MENFFGVLVELLKNTKDPLVLVVVVCLFALAVVYGCVRALATRK